MNKINELFTKELKVANIGIKSFYEDLKAQEKPAIHIQWKPIAGGDKRLAEMLQLLK